MTSIPFNKPYATGKEYEYMQEAVKRQHISGDGWFTKQGSKMLEELLGVPKVLLTTSCTHALELSALLLDIQPGDEVIVPSFTFVTTVNAFVLRGAKPVFIDIRPDILGMDETLLEDLITPRTKAIVPVHYAGVGCEMDRIMEITQKHNLHVVEDNAHGLFGKYKSKYLGTFGTFATQSFHETKNITSGEGGALLINDPAYIERAEIIREKGTDRSRFFRGQVDKYGWIDVGSSYLPSDMLAGFLLAQLENYQTIQSKRKQIWDVYQRELGGWAEDNQIQQPHIPNHCEQTYHMYYILLPSLDARQRLIKYLKEKEIQAVFHYLPLHLSQMGIRFGGKDGDCPVTEDISDRLLRLPFYTGMTQEEQAQVVDALLGFEV